MPTVLDSLVLEFNLDTSQFTREQQQLMDRLRRLEEETKTRAIDIEAHFKRIGGLFANLQRGALGIIGGFFGGEAIQMIGHFNNMEAGVGRVAQVINMSAQRTMAWSNAFKTLGMDANEGLTALQATAQTIFDAKITGNMSAGLFRVANQLRLPGQAGIDIMHGGEGGKEMTPEQAWLAISRRLDQMNIQGGDRAAYLRMAGAPQFMLMQSTQQIQKLVDTMEKLAPLTDAQVQQAIQFQKDTAELETSFQTLGRYITHELTPTLVAWMATLKEFVEKFNPQDPGGQGGWATWLGSQSVHEWLDKHLTPEGKAILHFDSGIKSKDQIARAAENDAEREAFIRETAKAVGLNPDVVVSTWSSEGRYGTGPRRKSLVPGEESYGDFQGNLIRGNLGDIYQKETGHQIGDPNFWKEEDRWMINQMRYNPAGLAPWHGWKGDPHAGGAGQGRAANQHVSFNIQHMTVQGSNAQEVAENLGRHTERIKTAYFGNSAAV